MTTTRLLLVSGALLCAGGVAAKPEPRRAIEPKADELLRKTSAGLATLKTFEVETRQITEVVTKDGEKLQELAGATLQVQRPDKLRSDRTGPLGGADVYYDGQTLSVYGERDKLYASTPAPVTLDAAIDFARDNLSLDAPAADLLNSNAYSTLLEDVVTGTYVGMDPVGDRMCHHLAFRGNETDWQLWVDESARALPCRFVITSKKEMGAPQYAVDLVSWKIDPSFAADTFKLEPPGDAKRIELATVSDTRADRQPRAARRTTHRAARRGAFTTTTQPPAAMVSTSAIVATLPASCAEAATGDTVIYECGGISYRPYYNGTNLVYQRF